MEAERAVLGAILLSPAKTFELLEGMRCSPDWFYIEAHRTIFETARGIHQQKGAGVDAVTVVSALQEAGALDAVGGAPAVERLVEGELVIAHAEYYADILRQKYVLRRIADAASAAIEKCYSPDRSTTAILSDTQEAMFAISEDEDTKQPSWNESLNATFGKIEKLFSDSSGMNGLSTGFKDLDKVMQGLRDSEMIVLAARPSMGKTSLAMNICTSVALDVDCNGKPRPAADRSKKPGENRVPVAIFSCEMSTDALITRLLCTLSGVPFTNIVDKSYVKASELPKMHQKITRAASVLMDAPIFIDDTGGLDIADVRSRARRLKKRHGIRLIMIDYLQLLNSREGSDEGRQQETTKISAGIKAMAKELNVPVIVLSQLSRAPEQRDKAAKPRLSDLRDSGSIEQDADMVLLLRRPCKYPGSPDSDQPNLAIVDVAKNRNGATGEVNLNFDGNAFPLMLADATGIGGEYLIVKVDENEMLLEYPYQGEEGPSVLGIYLTPKGKETYVHSFKDGDFGVTADGAEEVQPLVDQGITWEVSVDSDAPFYLMNKNAGLMIGRAWGANAAAESAKSARMWTESLSSKKIASVTVNTARFAPRDESTDAVLTDQDKARAELSVYVGGVKIGATYSIEPDMTPFTFTAPDPVGGLLEIKWQTTNNEINCFWVKSVQVIYEE